MLVPETSLSASLPLGANQLGGARMGLKLITSRTLPSTSQSGASFLLCIRQEVLKPLGGGRQKMSS